MTGSAFPPLTPAARVRQLIDAVHLHETLRRATEDYADLVGFGDGAPLTTNDARRLDDMVDAESAAQDMVVALAKTVNSEGLLERFAELLDIETAGRA